MYGRLTVLEEVEERKGGEKQYLCQCECGNRCVVRSYLLRKGMTKSCGCYAKEKARENMTKLSPKPIDLTGQKFGRLTVIALIDKEDWKYGSAVWKCRCECGRECNVASNALRTGHTKSCGCLNNELYDYRRAKLKEYTDERARSVIGRRYGDLTIIDKMDNICRCVCECGRQIDVPITSVYHMRHCGCKNGHRHDRKKIFQEVTGTMPDENMTVIFLDGNSDNIKADNMMAISRAAYLQMFRDGLFSKNPELTKTAAIACELSHKAHLALTGIRNT